MIAITPLYAILLTAIFFVLSVRVIQARRTLKIAYGSGDSTDTEALIRGHRNWTEYVPIAVILMAFAELQGASAFWLHLSGLCLLIGRALHGYGMGFNRKFFMGRVAGTGLTLTAILLLLLINIAVLF